MSEKQKTCLGFWKEDMKEIMSLVYPYSFPAVSKEKVRKEFEDMEKLFKKHRKISQKLWKETNDKSFLGNVTCSDMILDDLDEKKKKLQGEN